MEYIIYRKLIFKDCDGKSMYGNSFKESRLWWDFGIESVLKNIPEFLTEIAKRVGLDGFNPL